MKRSIDLVFSLAGLIVLMPLFFMIWTAIVLESGRPGFFRQIRVGRNCRDFVLFKFRTMTVQTEIGDGSFAPGNVTRVTRAGRILRKTKLDELPQLWNVFRGEMSLVGPRPEVRKWVEMYPDRWDYVLTVRPGITDSASIEYRNEEETLVSSSDPEFTYEMEILPRKLALYEEYVKRQSLLFDLQIIVKTIFAVMRG
jgi:lipopolysaccharide/colanic/teichoic acid biosynthesis glycosyltransferase